jgi:hypothetical protein
MVHFTHVSCWGVVRMYLIVAWVTVIPVIWKLNQKVMASWTYMKMHMSLHICKYMKFQLGGHPRSAIRLCIRLNGSNYMGRKDLPTNVAKWMIVNCILLKTTQRPYVAWSWKVAHIVCFKHNIGDEGCNYSSMVCGVWASVGIIQFTYISSITIAHHVEGIYGIQILLAH